MKTSTSLLVALLAMSWVVDTAAQSCGTGPYTTPTARFSNNEDGTVTDTRTGLIWKRCPEGFNLDDKGTPQTLGDDTCVLATTPYYTWFSALQHAENTGYAGYHDWRVPNIKELMSIIEYRCHNPAFNIAVFPEPLPIMNDYWTSSLDPETSGRSWDVDMDSGWTGTSSHLTTLTNYLLLVRRGL